ncbi:hypothetical protein UXO36_00100 [Enterobacter hormaechei]
MITFTKEQLIASAHARIEFAEMMLAGELEPLKERTWSIELELARIALASLEAEKIAEPVAKVETVGVCWYADNGVPRKPAVGTELYSAPPAPVSVPDERAAFNAWNNDTDCPLAGRDAKTAAWLAWCRRAVMLQGGEPVSNRDELPLDYLQGHKDGLEWAAQMAEANHPQTGDWLYDDPVELAKAIRKGPDMPELKSVPADADDNFYSWFGRFWSENYQQNNYTTSAKQMLGTMAEFAFRAGRESATQVGNSPVIPDGWVMVPVEPTMEMLDEFDSIIDHGAEDSKEAWSRLIAAAPQQEVK